MLFVRVLIVFVRMLLCKGEELRAELSDVPEASPVIQLAGLFSLSLFFRPTAPGSRPPGAVDLSRDFWLAVALSLSMQSPLSRLWSV